MSQQAAVPTVGHHKPKVLHIFVNGTRFDVEARVLTGAEILELAGLPLENHLFLELPGPGDDRPIDPTDEVKLRNGMRFYDVPVGNLG